VGVADIQTPAPPQSTNGHLGTAISNAVVSIYAEFLGRGPTRARTVIGPNLVTVVLQDTLTKGEQRLVAAGAGDSVTDVRRVFQQTMKDDLVDAVERITGRVVAAFLSDQSVGPDVAVEVFVLDPETPSPPVG
jgi:uncharacterized protein YbcI